MSFIKFQTLQIKLNYSKTLNSLNSQMYAFSQMKESAKFQFLKMILKTQIRTYKQKH